MRHAICDLSRLQTGVAMLIAGSGFDAACGLYRNRPRDRAFCQPNENGVRQQGLSITARAGANNRPDGQVLYSGRSSIWRDCHYQPGRRVSDDIGRPGR